MLFETALARELSALALALAPSLPRSQLSFRLSLSLALALAPSLPRSQLSFRLSLSSAHFDS